MMISLLYLHYLGEAVDVADIPAMLVVGHVEGRQVARGSDVRRTVGGGASQRHSLSTCQPDDALVCWKKTNPAKKPVEQSHCKMLPFRQRRNA